MTEEQTGVTSTTLERRLALLEQQTFRKKQRRKRVFLSVIALLLVAVVAAGIFVWHRQNTSFSHRLKALSVGYTLYAPSSNVGSYTLDTGSLQNNNGFVTFSLKNGQQAITVTEQAAPPNPPPLSSFEGFDKLDLAIGNAVVGTAGSRTISVIVTDSAVVSITSSEGVSKSAVSNLANSLHAVD
jgi:hypothetical protein